MKNQEKSLASVLSQRKLIKLEKLEKSLEDKVESLKIQQKYTFDVMLKEWLESKHAAHHPDLTLALLLAALILVSTVEVERSFSLLKLICTRLRSRLAAANLSHLMMICKFHRELTEEDYRSIMKVWLKADDTKSKKRRVTSRLVDQ